MLEPEPLQQSERTYVRFRRRKLSYFAGCDYFRLASHPRVISAIKTGIDRYGLSVAASRMTTGNHALYEALERALADFFGASNALVVPSGYMTNLVAAQALAGTFSHALLDERAHPSLADAASLLDCPVLRFGHRNPEDLECVVRRLGPAARLILLTDGLFAQDGSVAPLPDYLLKLPKDALLLVDDAHGAGILGKRGRGSLEHHGLNRTRIIQTLTLSKAFGTYGGVILGSAHLRRRMLKRSRLFTGCTPLPLPLVSAALESLRILQEDRSLRRRLLANVAYIRSALSAAGLEQTGPPGPIFAIPPDHAASVNQLKAALLKAGIFPPFIRYPGAPDTGYFRFVISSEHDRRQLEDLVDVLRRNLERPGKKVNAG